MRRFILQLRRRPPPWIPHFHVCTVCHREFPCELVDQCMGYVRHRPHIDSQSCAGTASFLGMDFAYSPSTGAFVMVGKNGEIITSVTNTVSWKPPKRSSKPSSWTQRTTGPLQDLRAMMRELQTYGAPPLDDILDADPILRAAYEQRVRSNPAGYLGRPR